MNARKTYLATIFAFILSIFSASAYNLPTEERAALDDAIANAAHYRQLKKHDIDSLLVVLSRLSSSQPAQGSNIAVERARLARKISELYRPMTPDSALVYADYAYDFAVGSGDSTAVQKARLARVNALSTGGLFVAALEEFHRAAKAPMNEKLKIDYWRSGRMVYSYMMTYAKGTPVYHSQYEHQYLAFDDSLLKHLPRTDLFYLFIRSERLVKDGDFNEAKRSLTFLLDTIEDTSNLYGMAAFQMAEVYRTEGEQELYATYLARAAASDIKCCVREGMALPTLAEWLYRQGKLDEAFRYINFAIGDASAGNTRMRAVAIAPMVPLIDDAYRDRIRSSQGWLTFSLVLVTIFLIVSAGLLVLVFRQRNRSRETQRKLKSLSRRQESYIGNFLELTSTYADKLDTMSKIVSRKLSAGQGDDLLKMVNAGKFAEQNDDFYRTIDHAFLDLYPEFVFEINKLLREDAQFVVPEGHTLTPELRIYAFVRLGVEESTRISQILRYSVSTVYAYRNRTRNRAIDRANFDKNVMEIGRNN